MSITTFVEKIKKPEIINSKDIKYIGIFFDKNSVLDTAENRQHLDKIIADPHITLAFNASKEQLEKLINFLNNHQTSDITATITRYGNDGKNEGFYVENISCSNGDTIPYFGAEQKHITISISKDSSAVKTGFMNFDEPIEPVTISGKIGLFMNDRSICFKPVEIEQENQNRGLRDDVGDDAR